MPGLGKSHEWVLEMERVKTLNPVCRFCSYTRRYRKEEGNRSQVFN